MNEQYKMILSYGFMNFGLDPINFELGIREDTNSVIVRLYTGCWAIIKCSGENAAYLLKEEIKARWNGDVDYMTVGSECTILLLEDNINTTRGITNDYQMDIIPTE